MRFWWRGAVIFSQEFKGIFCPTFCCQLVYRQHNSVVKTVMACFAVRLQLYSGREKTMQRIAQLPGLLPAKGRQPPPDNGVWCQLAASSLDYCHREPAALAVAPVVLGVACTSVRRLGAAAPAADAAADQSLP